MPTPDCDDRRRASSECRMGAPLHWRHPTTPGPDRSCHQHPIIPPGLAPREWSGHPSEGSIQDGHRARALRPAHVAAVALAGAGGPGAGAAAGRSGAELDDGQPARERGAGRRPQRGQLPGGVGDVGRGEDAAGPADDGEAAVQPDVGADQQRAEQRAAAQPGRRRPEPLVLPQGHRRQHGRLPGRARLPRQPRLVARPVRRDAQPVRQLARPDQLPLHDAGRRARLSDVRRRPVHCLPSRRLARDALDVLGSLATCPVCPALPTSRHQRGFVAAEFGLEGRL